MIATIEDIDAACALTGQTRHDFGHHDDCDPRYCSLAPRGVNAPDRVPETLLRDAVKPAGHGNETNRWKRNEELRHYEALSSSGGTYDVEERNDSVNGGTYWFCPCTGWAFQRGKGKDCKHVAEARMILR